MQRLPLAAQPEILHVKFGGFLFGRALFFGGVDVRSALREEGGRGCYCPVCAADEFSCGEGGEEAVHGFLQFGGVGGDGGVDFAEGEGELGEGAEAGGEGCCEGLEVVDWLLVLLLLRGGLGCGLGEEDEEVGVDVGAEGFEGGDGGRVVGGGCARRLFC